MAENFISDLMSVCLQLLHEEVLSHSALLDTISVKSGNLSENYVNQLELQELQERYEAARDNARVHIYIYYIQHVQC